MALRERVVSAMTATEDQDLMARIVAGDEQALGALYDRCGGLVYTIALRITGDPRRAQEVTQDVFQIVWTDMVSYAAVVRTVTDWIVGITRHWAIEVARWRRYTLSRHELSLDDLEAPQARHSRDTAHQAVLGLSVRTALTSLPEEQLEAIRLTYFGGLHVNEIASTLGVPVGTVKTWLRLGLVRLRAVLELDGAAGTASGETSKGTDRVERLPARNNE